MASFTILSGFKLTAIVMPTAQKATTIIAKERIVMMRVIFSISE